MNPITIPATASALIAVLGGHGNGDELVTALAIDTCPVLQTPLGEAVRIDIDPLGHKSLRLDLLLHLLGTFEPLFPSAGHLVGVLEYPEQGRVVLLPKPGNADDSGLEIFHDVLPAGAYPALSGNASARS